MGIKVFSNNNYQGLLPKNILPEGWKDKFSENDIINGINTLFGYHNKYKLYIDFKNHVEDYGNKGNDGSKNIFGDGVFLNGGHTVQIPVNPEKLGVNNDADTEVVNLLGLGEVNLLKGSHLKTISIESFFPNTYRTLTLSNNIDKIKSFFSFIGQKDLLKYKNKEIDFGGIEKYTNMIEGLYRLGTGDMPPYMTASYQPFTHQEFRNMFVNALENNTVVKFIATGADINMLMTIEKFDWDIRWGDDDIWYSMELKEYKPFKYSRVGETQNDYAVGDVVKYTEIGGGVERVGTIEKIDTKNGSKMYLIRDNARHNENTDFWNGGSPSDIGIPGGNLREPVINPGSPAGGGNDDLPTFDIEEVDVTAVMEYAFNMKQEFVWIPKSNIKSKCSEEDIREGWTHNKDFRI